MQGIAFFGLYLYNNLSDMMRKILSFVCAALLVAGLCGCNKIDVNKLEGTWSEQYDPAIFAMDGSVEYTFDGSNNYQLHVYDALSCPERRISRL